MNLNSMNKAQLIDVIEQLRGDLGEARRNVEAPTLASLPHDLLDWCYGLTSAQHLPEGRGREFFEQTILRAIPNALTFSPMAGARDRWAEAQGRLRDMFEGPGTNDAGPEVARIKLAKQLDWVRQLQSQADAYDELLDTFKRAYREVTGDDWTPPTRRGGASRQAEVPDNLDDAVAAQLAQR